MVNLLLSKGVDPDPKHNDNRTPLSYAASRGHTAVVNLLLSNGADPNPKDIYHRTPLSRALSKNQKGSHEGIIKLLRASVRPDPNDKDAHA